MPTLNAMFRLLDGYSAQLNRMLDKTDKMAASVLGASKNTDRLNASLTQSGAAAGAASAALGKLISVTAALAAAKTTMDLTDTYTNTKARLGMITDSLEEQEKLQKDIFAAADRARGSYTEMANATAKMRMLAGDSFGSNQEALYFTELLQKSLKVSGASQGEQDSAFLQLTQAMAAGKLQGDEFRAIIENAPMVSNAIMDYMGIDEGELKELSSDGVITADIIKNAMFNAADDINGKFNSMPMTFADTWTKIKNAGNQAFGDFFEKLNGTLNSEGAQAALNNLIGLIYMAGGAMENFIDFCVAAWPMVSPFIWAAVAALSAYAVVQGRSIALSLLERAQFAAQVVSVGLYALALWATTGATWAETTAMLGLNSALYACPLVWIVGLVLLLTAAFYAGVGAVNHFTGSTISATGIIGGVLGAWAASTINLFILIYNTIAEVVNFFANVWKNPVAAVKILFYDLAVTVVGYITEMAKAVEAVINRIPGVEVSISAGLDQFTSGIEKAAQEAKDKAGWEEVVKKKDFLSGADFANAGYNAGAGIESKVTGFFSGFNPNSGGAGDGLGDFSRFGAPGSPATVKGTGKGGAVKVESEEDIEWMRKLAERDYVARIAQNTLAPNIRVDFSGPITKEADTDGVMAHVVAELKDIIAVSPEGVPE